MATEPGPMAALKAANAERAAAWNAEPEEPEEEPLMPTFKVALPALTVGDRWELARFLDETAARTLADPDNSRVQPWQLALRAVLTDLAAEARSAKGRKVASAQEAADVASPVTLAVTVSLNPAAREKLHKVFKVARNRAPDGPAGRAAVAIADEFERFVYGRKGEPAEPPRRGGEPPGLWEPLNVTASILTRFRR